MAFPHAEALQALKDRRSVRQFRPDPIDETALQAVLEAGLYAPSGRNTQSPRLVVVQNAATRATLTRLNRAVLGTTDGDPFYGASTILVVFADSENPTGLEDACLVMGNLLNAAYDVGLGACWIHRARQVFAGEEGRALMQEWDIPAHFVGVGHISLGYAADALPPAAPRQEGRIHYVR